MPKAQTGFAQKIIKAQVTAEGLLVPRQLLAGIREVEIRREEHLISIVPLALDDLILELGQSPIFGEPPDVSERHDQYIYPAR
ncbi:MAG TPA: hypothetical protein ENJ31_04645 [Anaerolineae bacterium]|nr:hypothetical protein [Anaerolineae bacterium]